MPDDLITTDEAANILGISRRRVTALIRTKRLPAEMIGRDWLIRKSDLDVVSDRKAGRPRKVKP